MEMQGEHIIISSTLKKDGDNNMGYDDIKRMNTHIQNKHKTRWTEYPIGHKFDTTPSRWHEEPLQPQPKRTWSHKNIIPNMKNAWSKTKKYGGKAVSGYSKVQTGLAKTFPGIADGSFDREIFGFESPYQTTHNKRRRKK